MIDGRDALRAVQRPLADASHAPGFLYASPDVYRREVEQLFMRDWLFVARAEELPDPGDYMALRIAGAGFALGEQRMRPLRLETWCGNVFVSFDPDAAPLAEHLREFEKDFAFLQMEHCRLRNRIVLDLACNWKFVHENLMDFYHVGVLHAKTFGARFSWEDDQVRLQSRGAISIFYDAGPPTPNAEPLLGKMPWLDDRPVSFSCTGFLPPNCTLFGRIDCVRFMVAWPDGPDRSRTMIYHLFPKEFFARPGFAETLTIYRDYQLQILEEDRSMIESMQLAMASPAYRPGRMSTLEKPLHHYLNGYIDRVFGTSSGA